MLLSGPALKRVAAGLMFVGFLTGPALSLSDQYETAPEQAPATLLNGKDFGPGYAILPPVRSNGFFYAYQLQASQGVETVQGTGLLNLRLSEIKAYVALESLKKDTSFLEGLKQSAQKPVDFVESTISDPVGTAKNTVSGVGRVFGRLGKGVEAAVTGQGGSATDIAKSITGQAKARRELAVELGVDPYTFDKLLSAKLDETASVTAAGSWTVTAITALIPGGVFVNATRTADDFRNVIVDSTENELRERTAETFRSAGISETNILKIEANPHYTASEKAAIAYQLAAMPGVQNLDLIAEDVAKAAERSPAYFQLRRVVLLENYNRTISGLGQIRDVAGLSVAIRRDGMAAIVMPYDIVAWTQTTAMTFSSLQEGLNQLPFPPTGVDLLITGDLTQMAAERLTAYGWQITGNFPMPDGPVH
ncbi:hypothetical protein [Labrenzia sp. PHM005]|uniref:hypothetical protein n=1 Tax=Labrenzia sp. PHM005 TaxID=2590016 RepID=UPI00113FE648|nr:hypothetical protein [Labrenzia sp. PHM005]QDG75073.1 hypothetical protein FJ695_03900 [Labrenzia sp. PHM005]